MAGHHLPTVGRLETGDVHYAHGYTGNGVGPSHLVGQMLATRVLHAPDPALEALPIATLEPLRFPPEPIRSPGALIANTAIRRKDEAEDRGEDPNPLVDFVAKLPAAHRLQPGPLAGRNRVGALPGMGRRKMPDAGYAISGAEGRPYGHVDVQPLRWIGQHLRLVPGRLPGPRLHHLPDSDTSAVHISGTKLTLTLSPRVALV